MPCNSFSSIRAINPLISLVSPSLSSGYSRFPIHEPGKPLAFVGLLLIKKVGSHCPALSIFWNSIPLTHSLRSCYNTTPQLRLSRYQVSHYRFYLKLLRQLTVFRLWIICEWITRRLLSLIDLCARFQSNRSCTSASYKLYAWICGWSYWCCYAGGCYWGVFWFPVWVSAWLTWRYLQEIISEEIVDETDRYEDNVSKRRARRATTATIMRGWVSSWCVGMDEWTKLTHALTLSPPLPPTQSFLPSRLRTHSNFPPIHSLTFCSALLPFSHHIESSNANADGTHSAPTHPSSTSTVQPDTQISALSSLHVLRFQITVIVTDMKLTSVHHYWGTEVGRWRGLRLWRLLRGIMRRGFRIGGMGTKGVEGMKGEMVVSMGGRMSRMDRGELGKASPLGIGMLGLCIF